MIRLLKTFVILITGLTIFALTSYKFDGLQALLETIAFKLPSSILSIVLGSTTYLIFKSHLVAISTAVIVALFIQLGELTTNQISFVSYIIFALTIYFSTNQITKQR